MELKELKRVRVVLVETKFSGNIGLVARVMKNLGFEDLRLVKPRAELNREAYARAISGSDIIDRSEIHNELYPAIKDCQLVIGTSRRHGVKRKNVISPEEMAELIISSLEVNNIALVFGSEDTGLSNQDIKYCQWVVGIHPGTKYESLSLSHAVAIILWEINSALRNPRASIVRREKLASSEEMEQMFEHLQEVLTEIDFTRPGDPRRMMLSFRAIFNRAQMSSRDVNIIRGLLRQVNWKIESERKPGGKK